MLAEQKYKQKWSSDPRNTQWVNDKNKFGYQLMKKMGWTDGKGLGVNENGDVSNIKVHNKADNLGVGSNKSDGYEWTSHHDNFNSLLENLNAGVTNSATKTEQVSSLEESVKASKTKIGYHKFIKSKDLSNASSDDIACIFGTKKKKDKLIFKPSEDDNVDSSFSSVLHNFFLK
jgi:Pin2-interacting protein X1